MSNLVLNHTKRAAGALTTLCLWMTLGGATAQEPAAFWPRRVEAQPYKVALYEPQVESYDQDWMTARAAISVTANGAEPVFGAVWFGLRLEVNAPRTLARVNTLRLDQMRFPGGDVIERSLLDRLLGSCLVGADLPLEPLLASLARDRVEAEAANAGNQAVPDIVFATFPVALVRVDGEPELKGLPNLDLLTVTNSNTPIFLQKGSTLWFMQVDGQWLTAAAVTGPWRDADAIPESVKKAVEASAPTAPVAPSPAPRPQIVVVTRPTEVICTEGEPCYAVIPGTGLLYVKNTEADLFLDIAGQMHYALLAGRWFATPDPQAGPWQVVPGDKLPSGFALIPETSPKYGLLAHVPGTTVAQEAVQDAEVPRTQAIKREVTTLTVEYEGTPEFVPAGTTTVYYAVNTPYSVLRWNSSYYLCHRGAWYFGAAAAGPWTVCVDVPGVIYTIPPVCPVYPVTYVRVYDWTPEVVYCGFTSGYLGWYVGGPSLVFGMAYYDTAWWGHRSSGYYYHQNYRCGYYPSHRPYGDGHDLLLPLLFPPLLPLPFPPFYHRRPGPEYHRASYDRRRDDDRHRDDDRRGDDDRRRDDRRDFSPQRASARPNRYDQEPTSSLARRIHGDSPSKMPTGRDLGSRDPHPDKTPTGRDLGSRDPHPDKVPAERADKLRPERPDRTAAERADTVRPGKGPAERADTQRPGKGPAERADTVRPERPERTATERPAPNTTPSPNKAPAERTDKARPERPERTATERPALNTTPSPDKAPAERTERARPERTAVERLPQSDTQRPDKAAIAPQPVIRSEPAVREERTVRPQTVIPRERVERRTEVAPSVTPVTPTPRPETRIAPARETELRTTEPTISREALPTTPKARAAPSREAEAESRRTAPSREAAAESRRTAPTPAPVVRTQPEGETAGEGTVEERSAPQSAPASTSGRSRKSERGR